MHKVRINQGRILPWQFRFAGTGFVFIAVAAALANLPEKYAIPISIIVSFFLPLIWSSYYLFELDPANKKIGDFYWVAGIKMGKTTNYEEIDYIYINSVNTSQKVTSYSGHVSAFEAKEFTAFLKLTDGRTFELLTRKNLDSLRSKMKPIGIKLDCPVHENV